MNPTIEGCRLQLVIPSEASWLMQIQDHPLLKQDYKHCNEPAVTLNDKFGTMTA